MLYPALLRLLCSSALANQSLLVDIKHITTSVPAQEFATDTRFKTPLYCQIQRDLPATETQSTLYELIWQGLEYNGHSFLCSSFKSSFYLILKFKDSNLPVPTKRKKLVIIIIMMSQTNLDVSEHNYIAGKQTMLTFHLK